MGRFAIGGALLVRPRLGIARGLWIMKQEGVCDVQFRQIDRDRKRYLDLLLLADEQEDMIDRYL